MTNQYQPMNTKQWFSMARNSNCSVKLRSAPLSFAKGGDNPPKARECSASGQNSWCVNVWLGNVISLRGILLIHFDTSEFHYWHFTTLFTSECPFHHEMCSMRAAWSDLTTLIIMAYQHSTLYVPNHFDPSPVSPLHGVKRATLRGAAALGSEHLADPLNLLPWWS